FFYSPLFFSLSSCSFLLFTHSSPSSLYSLSLHDALPIFKQVIYNFGGDDIDIDSLINDDIGDIEDVIVEEDNIRHGLTEAYGIEDRKSTRLNSSHVSISYAVFCLKKKKNAATETGWCGRT